MPMDLTGYHGRTGMRTGADENVREADRGRSSQTGQGYEDKKNEPQKTKNRSKVLSHGSRTCQHIREKRRKIIPAAEVQSGDKKADDQIICFSFIKLLYAVSICGQAKRACQSSLLKAQNSKLSFLL